MFLTFYFFDSWNSYLKIEERDIYSSTNACDVYKSLLVPQYLAIAYTEVNSSLLSVVSPNGILFKTF